MVKRNKGLLLEQREELLSILKARFEKNLDRDKEIEWAKVEEKLKGNDEKLWSLEANTMEKDKGWI